MNSNSKIGDILLLHKDGVYIVIGENPIIGSYNLMSTEDIYSVIENYRVEELLQDLNAIIASEFSDKVFTIPKSKIDNDNAVEKIGSAEGSLKKLCERFSTVSFK